MEAYTPQQAAAAWPKGPRAGPEPAGPGMEQGEGTEAVAEGFKMSKGGYKAAGWGQEAHAKHVNLVNAAGCAAACAGYGGEADDDFCMECIPASGPAAAFPSATGRAQPGAGPRPDEAPGTAPGQLPSSGGGRGASGGQGQGLGQELPGKEPMTSEGPLSSPPAGTAAYGPAMPGGGAPAAKLTDVDVHDVFQIHHPHHAPGSGLSEHRSLTASGSSIEAAGRKRGSLVGGGSGGYGDGAGNVLVEEAGGLGGEQQEAEGSEEEEEEATPGHEATGAGAGGVLEDVGGGVGDAALPMAVDDELPGAMGGMQDVQGVGFSDTGAGHTLGEMLQGQQGSSKEERVAQRMAEGYTYAEM